MKTPNELRREMGLEPIGDDCKHEVNVFHNYVLTCENCGYKRKMTRDLQIYDVKYSKKKGRVLVGDNPLHVFEPENPIDFQRKLR